MKPATIDSALEGLAFVAELPVFRVLSRLAAGRRPAFYQADLFGLKLYSSQTGIYLLVWRRA